MYIAPLGMAGDQARRRRGSYRPDGGGGKVRRTRFYVGSDIQATTTSPAATGVRREISTSPP